jgi:Zn-dependent M28 family amino/carboxypeptidase
MFSNSAAYRGFLLTCVLSAGALSCACSQQKAADKPGSATAEAANMANSPQVLDTSFPPDNAALPSINANRALQYTKEVTAFGPRPIGSANHKKLEEYIHAHLKGDDVEEDSFTADTPEGKFPVRNIIVKFPGSKDAIIVIAGHYDTPYYLRNTGFVGANDGGSSTGMLLELANQFRGKKRDGYSVWLLFTDGEEAVKEWTDTDSVYGTRHISDVWQKNGTLPKIKAFILQDMIGDADLNIDRDQNSTPWLEDVVYQAASRYGYQSHFFERNMDDRDDHLPFAKKGVPVADLIDLNYGYGNAFWHTPQDTMDKVSAKSLQIAGDTILESVRILDIMPAVPPPKGEQKPR